MFKKLSIPTILFACVLFFSLFLFIKENKKQTPQENNVNFQETQNNEISETYQDNHNLEENINRIDEKSVGDIILFYGDGCPHCKVLEQYIKENKIKSKLTFAEKEIYSSTENTNLLIEKSVICKIPNDMLGVPFLWDGTGCYMGYEDVINFFKLKIKI